LSAITGRPAARRASVPGPGANNIGIPFCRPCNACPIATARSALAAIERGRHRQHIAAENENDAEDDQRIPLGAVGRLRVGQYAKSCLDAPYLVALNAGTVAYRY
jgi:hypothetical protein